MAHKLTQEEREALYKMLYIKISKATAEVTENNQTRKTIFKGLVSDLFADCNASSYMISRFLWAVSHKTNALPTTLFKIVNRGKQGVEISRIHSGFYAVDGEHIIGVYLIPYIMSAVSEYTPDREYHRTQNVVSAESFVDISVNNCNINYEACSEDELYSIISNCEAEIRRREELEAKQARIQTILDSVGMTREELLDLLEVC